VLKFWNRVRPLKNGHIIEAFEEARTTGSAILAIANYDYRDMRPDVIAVQSMIATVKSMYPDVSFKYAGAHEAVIQLTGWQRKPKRFLAIFSGLTFRIVCLRRPVASSNRQFPLR